MNEKFYFKENTFKEIYKLVKNTKTIYFLKYYLSTLKFEELTAEINK